MNLMFWKKKPKNGDDADAPQEAENDKTVAMDVPVLDTPAKPGLISRVKIRLSELVQRFKKSPASPPDSGEEGQAPISHDTPAIQSMRTKKRLIIGGAAGLLFLLLVGIGFATWKFFLSSPEQGGDAHPATPATDASHSSQPVEHASAEPAESPRTETTQADTPQAEIDALRKQNEELQAQIETLKKEKPQEQSSISTAGAAGEKSDPNSSPGEITISNTDPKAAAQSLKEAIEAMNASSGSSARKPAK